MKIHLFSIALLLLCGPSFVSSQDLYRKDENFRVKTEYDKRADISLIRVGPMILVGRLANLPEYRLSAFYTFPGKQPLKSEFVTVAIDSVVKPEDRRISTQDRVLQIVADDVTYKIGVLEIRLSNPGKDIAIEYLTVAVPRDTFNQVITSISTAKRVEVKLGRHRILLGNRHIEALVNFAKKATM